MVLPQDEPRIEAKPEFTVVGFAKRGTPSSDFGTVWDRFNERAGDFLPLAEADEGYAVEYDFLPNSDAFTYLAGVRTAEDTTVPSGATKVTVPAQTYAVFTTTLSDVNDTVEAINSEWFPTSEYKRGEGPSLEYYDSDFDPRMSGSTFEVLVPIVER